MGVKFLVKKTTLCGYDSTSEAIANPYQIITNFYQTEIPLSVTQGKHSAIQYNNLGTGVEYDIYAINLTEIAGFKINVFDSIGDFYSSNTAIGNTIDEYIDLPASTPFYIVLENTDGGFLECESFSVELKDSTPTCGYNTIAGAINDPYAVAPGFSEQVEDVPCDGNKYVAIQYNTNGGGSTGLFSLSNETTPASNVEIIVVNSSGGIVDSYTSLSGGSIENESLDLPAGLPFYYVIHNLGSNCDDFTISVKSGD